MKNLMTKSKSILVLGVATMMMFSCEMMEPMAPAERAMEAEEMMAGSAFNLSAFGMGMENARVYEEDAWETSCITSDPETWFLEELDNSYQGGGEVVVQVFNTPEKIVYSLTSAEDIKVVFFNGVEKYRSNTPAAQPYVIEVDLGEFGVDWMAGNEETALIQVRRNNSSGGGAGQQVSFSTNYKLVGVCPPVEEACDNSLSYVDNGDGSYTFSFTPRSSMTDAHLVFTFAQGVTVGGDLASWDGAGVTRQKTMNLSAMATYEWTVELEANCPGAGQPRANLWTDFTVNGESKKCDLENIVISCR